MPKITYVAQTFPAMIGNWISIAEYDHPRTLKQAQEDIVLAEKQDKSPTKSAKRIIKRYTSDDGKITETVFSGVGASSSSSSK